MRDLPMKSAQLQAISRWLIKYGGRRPSEAAMEVTAMGDARRRKLFRTLRDLKCIAHHEEGWHAIADVPTYETAVIRDDT